MSSMHCLAPIVAAPPYRCGLWRCHGLVIVPSRAGHQGCVPYPCAMDRARRGRTEWLTSGHTGIGLDIGLALGATDVAGDASSHALASEER